MHFVPLQNVPPDIKQLLLVALAAPGFWELIKLIWSKLADLVMAIVAPDRKKATLKSISQEIKNVQAAQEEAKKDSALVHDDLKAIHQQLQEDDEKRERDKADAARNRILRFSDEIMHGALHSEEYFNQIMADITYYRNYCDAHPHYQNNKAKAAIENIERVYAVCIRENKFLHGKEHGKEEKAEE